jgi:hypothetical protein
MLVRRDLGGGHYVEWDDATEFVDVGERLVPPRFLAVLPPWDERVGMRVAIEVRAGVPVCRRLEFEAAPDGRDLRPADLAINLDAVVEAMCASVALHVVDESADPSGLVIGGNPDTPFWGETLREMRRARVGRPVKLSDERIQKAAEVYRANVGDRPTEAVAAAFGVAHRTAAKYVMEARARGFLPATTPGKKQA